jgi:hypothetical protein
MWLLQFSTWNLKPNPTFTDSTLSNRTTEPRASKNTKCRTEIKTAPLSQAKKSPAQSTIRQMQITLYLVGHAP